MLMFVSKLIYDSCTYNCLSANGIEDLTAKQDILKNQQKYGQRGISQSKHTIPPFLLSISFRKSFLLRIVKRFYMGPQGAKIVAVSPLSVAS